MQDADEPHHKKSCDAGAFTIPSKTLHTSNKKNQYKVWHKYKKAG